VLTNDVAKMPPEIACEVLRTALDLPSSEDIEALMIDKKIPPGPSPFGAPSALTRKGA